MVPQLADLLHIRTTGEERVGQWVKDEEELPPGRA